MSQPEQHTDGKKLDQSVKDPDATVVLPKLPVLCIGASAGGVKPLLQFFSLVAPDLGIAYAVVMHLSPEHRSALPELIGRRTEMPAQPVTEKVSLEKNTVYVVPPDRQLLATDTSLETVAFEEPRGRRLPIDMFFISLAKAHGDGFALILSGGGDDGAHGVRAIKEAGGIILAQDPNEAEYDSMPRAAIATGHVDEVLPVRMLAKKIEELAKIRLQLPKQRAKSAQHGTQEEDPYLSKVLSLLQARSSHDFFKYKRSMVQRRILRRMQLAHVHSMEDYHAVLREDEEQVELLLNDLLISVTSFFRDRESFQALREQVIGPVLEQADHERGVRVWVPGCATGEEAYSLAICLLEGAYEQNLRQLQVQIFASDPDPKALDTARQGRYPTSIEQDVPEELLRRYFAKSGDEYQVIQEVRDCILFASHNLLRDAPFTRMDLVSCRNLLIYFDVDLQEKVFSVFHYSLRPKGFLFLGSAETAEREYFHPVDQKHRIYRAVERLSDPPSHVPTLLTGLAMNAHKKERDGERHGPSLVSTTRAHRVVLEENAPPSVLVDQAHRIVHLSEKAGRYLEPGGGPFSADLVELVRPELQSEVRAGLFRAFEYGRPTLSGPIPVRFNGSARRVAVHIQPRGSEESERNLALVVFLEGEEIAEGDALETSDTESQSVDQLADELHHTQQLLRTTREEYEAANEELHASNEELQSINEEYRSTSEELETSKEELQSINEEMQAVNLELKDKLEEISETHSDLENLVAASEVGTLFLDRSLRIKRFTPIVAELYHVTSQDRGRPITDLAHRLEYSHLKEDCYRVLEQLTTLEHEIHTDDARWFSVRIGPYRTVDDRIDGLVLTFYEITDRKRIENALTEKEEQLALVHSAAGVEWWNVNLDQGTMLFSERWCKVLGLNEGDSLTVDEFSQRIVHPDDRASFERVFSAPIKESTETDLEFRVEHPTDGERWLLSRGRVVSHASKNVLRTAVIDVTEKKLSQKALEQANHRLEARSHHLRKMASRLTLAEQEERGQIAEVLHDDLQQLLYGVRLRITELLRSADQFEGEVIAARLTEIYDRLGDAVASTRGLANRLAVPAPDSKLSELLESVVMQMEETQDLEVDLDVRLTDVSVGEELRIVLLQAVRELLFNVAKHAETNFATILVEAEEDNLKVTVSDGGVGFDPEDLKEKSGFGLETIGQRIELLGGSLDIVSHPGDGVTVTIESPF